MSNIIERQLKNVNLSLKKTSGHWKISVVVGISGQTFEMRKNVKSADIQQLLRTSKLIYVSSNKLKIDENPKGNQQKRR